MILKQVVGAGAANQSRDVRAVQILLNANLERVAGAVRLAVDGQIGAGTLAAIAAFERQVLGRSTPTGVVPPDGTLLAELRRGLAPGLTPDKLSFVMLAAPVERLSLVFPALADSMRSAGIDTPLRQAHFLAQTGHESGDLRYTEELASGAAYEGRKALGNSEPGDGPRFKGRGLIQLTGRANYKAYGESIGVDLTSAGNWARVATDLNLAVGVACWFWTRAGLNALADHDDVIGITKRINGGLNGLADRQDHLERAKFALIPA